MGLVFREKCAEGIRGSDITTVIKDGGPITDGKSHGNVSVSNIPRRGVLMKLEDTFKNLQYIDNNGYQYFLHPLTDGTSPIDGRHLYEFSRWAYSKIRDMKPDSILTAEAMGIPIATALSMYAEIPMSIARKRRYGLSGEIDVLKQTGYSKEHIYVNGLKEGDRVVIVDDVCDTGGTLIALTTELMRHGIDVVGALFLVSKKTTPRSGLYFPIYSFTEID